MTPSSLEFRDFVVSWRRGFVISWLVIVGGAFAACDFGGTSRAPINSPGPTAPAPPGAPQISIISVIPNTGATPTYTLRFSAAAGTGCGQGLLGGGALTFDDGTMQDSIDVNGNSGIPAFSVDANCSFTSVGAVPPPQSVASGPAVRHVVAITVYLSPPSPDTLGDPPAHHPTLSDAVAASRYQTSLYLLGLGVRSAAPLPNVDGVWRGTILDAVAGSGSLSVALTGQDFGASAYGSFSFEFPRSQFNLIGSALGTIDDSSVLLLLTPGASACPLVMRWTLNGTAASGTYGAASGCPLTPNGTVSLNRT